MFKSFALDERVVNWKTLRELTSNEINCFFFILVRGKNKWRICIKLGISFRSFLIIKCKLYTEITMMLLLYIYLSIYLANSIIWQMKLYRMQFVVVYNRACAFCSLHLKSNRIRPKSFVRNSFTKTYFATISNRFVLITKHYLIHSLAQTLSLFLLLFIDKRNTIGIVNF